LVSAAITVDSVIVVTLLAAFNDAVATYNYLAVFTAVSQERVSVITLLARVNNTITTARVARIHGARSVKPTLCLATLLLSARNNTAIEAAVSEIRLIEPCETANRFTAGV
jgi:hypothetical protein